MKNTLTNETQLEKDIVPKLLKDIRIKLGFTQKELAEKIGIKRDTYANYEYGRSRISLGVYFKIQNLLETETQKGDGSQ